MIFKAGTQGRGRNCNITWPHCKTCPAYSADRANSSMPQVCKDFSRKQVPDCLRRIGRLRDCGDGYRITGVTISAPHIASPDARDSHLSRWVWPLHFRICSRPTIDISSPISILEVQVTSLTSQSSRHPLSWRSALPICLACLVTSCYSFGVGEKYAWGDPSGPHRDSCNEACLVMAEDGKYCAKFHAYASEKCVRMLTSPRDLSR